MSRCDDCTHAREGKDLNWRRYDCFACPYCAARLIQAIGRHQIAESEVTKRRKAVITEAAERGLDAALIRKLAKGAVALQPLPEIKDKKK